MANRFKSFGQRLRSWFTARKQRPLRKQAKRCRPQLEVLEDRTLPSVNPGIGDVFYIEMENHNFTQPNANVGALSTIQQIQGNPAAPFINSLITPGNPNAAMVSYATQYHNVLATPSGNNPSIHPSEPNYVWQEAGLTGPLNDADPFPNNIVNAPNLSGLLQAAGISWKSYQEGIDLLPTSGTVNQPGANSLTNTVAPQSQWTVPLKSFSGTSPSYTNPYNGSHQYNFSPKHDGQLFFTDTNGGNSFSPSNPESQFYAPLEQFQTDLNNNTVARYSLITPDQFNDMHSTLSGGFTYNSIHYTGDSANIAQGDNFLSKIIPMIEASAAFQNNGEIVIWNDETEPQNSSDTTFNDFNHTSLEIVISPLAKGNAYASTLNYTHSSDLKTLQETYGVSAPGGGFLGDANTPGTNDLSDMFLPSPGATVQNNTLFLVGGNTNDHLNITPIGTSPTGSTGVNVDGQLNGVNIHNQTFTGITSISVVGFGGNDNFQFASSLTLPTVIRGGDGNDQVQLGNGNNVVTLGNGNDQVQAGNGNNVITAGTGNDNIKSGDGINTILVGAANSRGNIQVQLGDGANTVTLLGNGNDQVQAGNGANKVSITGNGNDHVQLGDGNNDSVSINGNGNDHVQIGNGLGDFLSLVGDGNDDVQTGNGSGQAHVAGAGHKTVHLGSGWTQI